MSHEQKRRRFRSFAEKKRSVKLHTDRAIDSAALATQAIEDGEYKEAAYRYRTAAHFCDEAEKAKEAK